MDATPVQQHEATRFKLSTLLSVAPIAQLNGLSW